MKSLLPKLLAIVLLASCSAPKYSYYFDRVDYNAGKRKKAAVENAIAQKEIVKDIPVTPNPDQETILASAEEQVVVTKTAPSLQAEKKEMPAISKEQRKHMFREFKSAIKEYKKSAKSLDAEASTKGGDKNQLVALLLAIFLGGFGIHRFYLGRIGTAILQLLLLIIGLFTVFPLYVLFVWVLIDIILIAMGDLTPKGGSYNPEL